MKFICKIFARKPKMEAKKEAQPKQFIPSIVDSQQLTADLTIRKSKGDSKADEQKVSLTDFLDVHLPAIRREIDVWMLENNGRMVVGNEMNHFINRMFVSENGNKKFLIQIW